MTIEDRLRTPEVEADLEKEERARRVVARARANKQLMDGLRETLEARLRGEKGVPFEALTWKDA